MYLGFFLEGAWGLRDMSHVGGDEFREYQNSGSPAFENLKVRRFERLRFDFKLGA